MADETAPHISLRVPQSRTRRQSATSSERSSNSEDNSASSNPSRRRQSSSTSNNVALPTGASSDRQRGRRTTKSLSSASHEGSPQGSATTMPGMVASAGEITYTPTTHRISKAKKGKKVHACEHPGCTKIFTRAEHRKRHEANHNSEPLYQCWIQECRKPFQRSDLLARHMEKQHNMPTDSFSTRSTRSPRSTREASFADSSPSTSSTFATLVGQQRVVPTQTSTMSIGSIISEPGMGNDYVTNPGQPMNDLSHVAISTVPRSLPPDLVFQLPASVDSPLYPSSDSCYSPMSDYLQTQASTPQFLTPDTLPRSQSAALESCFPNRQLFTSPISLTPTVPTWDQFEDAALGISYDSSCNSNIRQYQYPSPTWMGINGYSYEMNLPPQQIWPWAKVDF